MLVDIGSPCFPTFFNKENHVYKSVQNLRKIYLFLNKVLSKRPTIQAAMSDQPYMVMHPSELLYTDTTILILSYFMLY